VDGFDGGKPSLVSNTLVSIEVSDANDNDPVFEEKEYVVAVSEVTTLGDTVVEVKAVDNDEDSQLRYEIVGGNTRNRFTISSQNGRGIVSVAQPLSYRDENNFLITVNAVDKGGRFGTCNIVINIVDANDHAPKFENTPYFADIFEDVPIGSTVLMLFASDQDYSQNAHITYKLDSDSDKFAVDSQTGALTVSEDLDRESVSTYILSVIAEDGGIPKLSDRTELEISVLDVNDNFPVFSRGSYTGTLTENAVVGTKVLRVSATDRDERDNGKIEYKFSNSHDQSTGAFVIDPISGDVRSDKPLDREAKAFYELVVIAYDGGMPEKSAQAMIRIDIVDVNDSPPKFISDELTFWLEENSPYGTRIGQIRVTDADVSENSEITFQLLNSSDSRFFYLGEFQKSGGISLFAKKEFDYERDRREYQIGIRAESAPLRTDANIVINLRDANDNQPELEDFEIVHNTQVDEYQFDVLGRVPAHDADPTGNLTYNFTYGNNADFLLLDHATGEIRLSPLVKSDVNLRAKVGVMVSDGQNDVRANLKLQINYITETMLKNSVTMRIANVTENTFLQPFFSYLQEALSIAIPCSKDEVIIFGIKSGLDGTIIGSINVTFAISVGESNRGEFLASSFVKQRVYLLQDVMEKILDLEVLPFADDICVKEPCLNYEQCATIPKFGQLHEVLSYHSVTFRSINTLLTYSCNCPDGFTGMTTRYTCDTKINLCYSGPCQNGAGCTATESGYTCQCPEGFAGQLCEVDLTKKNCSSELCHSPAECEVKPDNDVGIKCTNCSGNPYFDSLCRLTSRSFSEGAFSAFAALKQRVEFNISLEFVTQSMDGLLFYNGRLNDENDFIALELTKKTLIFHYSTGEEIGTTSVRQGKGFSDGQFHSVEILYDNGDVTLSVDGCDTKLAIKFASDLEDRWKCANQTIVSQRKSCGAFLNHCPKFLDLTGPFLLGGVPLGRTGIRKFATDHFTGCIRNLAIDGRVFNLNDMVFNNGSITGCPEKRNFCKSNPCQNKGTCDDGWSSYLCTCPEGFTGKDCSLEATDIVGLGEQTKLDYRAKLSPVRFPWLQSISFKTSVADGVRELMTVTLGHNEAESVITIEDGIVHYTFEEAKIRLDSSFVADNRWHNIQVKWMLKEIWLNLDYGQHETTSDYYNAFGGKLVTKIRIGKRKGSDALPFIGCVQEIEVGDDDDPRVDLLTQENAQDCKDVTESNLMLPATSTTLSSSSCQLRRRSSQECVSFCDLGLCEGGSSCVEEQMGVSYTCECSDPNSSVGRYCQPKPREVCPRHWWGTPVCGPCNCDAGNGFNETCDASTGECGCKNYHYTEHDEDNEDNIRCLACHCYPTGSLSTSCHAETGQCQCKEGVIGKRCNTCSNKFAELSSDGCKVIYGACPAEYEGDIFWERTQFDSQKTSNCPDSSVGVVTRNCSEGGWGQADFSSCTHKEFLKLQTADPNTESWLTIRTIGSALEKQASFSRRYKNDVTAVYASIDKVLKKEANLTGFQLAHRKDRTFLNNLFKIVSWLLDSDNIKMFEIMKLVLSVHAYGSTVANSMTDTFTHPFEIVTDNVIFGLDTEKTNVRRRRSLPLIGGHAEITYPKYNNFMRSPNAWQTTSLTMDSPSSTIIQYLIVRADNSDLERDLVMIPKVRWNTKLSMFSDVLSFSSSIDAGDRRLQFRSKLHHPQNVLHCVNWNTELDIWSSIDCDTNYERSSAFSAAGSQQSTTTVDCACSEGDAFGVVEEFVGKGQVYFVTSETELLFATFVAISIVILFVTFICLVVLNRQSRNSVSIQRNITSSVLLFQLTYLLAIVFNEDLVDEYITLCKAIAIVLHFTSVSAFSWLFLSSFHIYRMVIIFVRMFRKTSRINF
jgi:cadherin EGF LAG seven-pass G-type receptor 1